MEMAAAMAVEQIEFEMAAEQRESGVENQFQVGNELKLPLHLSRGEPLEGIGSW